MEFLVGAIVLLGGIVIGLFLGMFIGMERMRKAIEDQSVGHLRIDRSEPDEPPKPFLEVNSGTSIDDISKKRFVILKVSNENYLSRN
jgi:hypothetical protein